MPYIIEDYEYIAKRQAEIKKNAARDDSLNLEQEDEVDIDDILIVGYSGDFF